jgi:hypothetical protein
MIYLHFSGKDNMLPSRDEAKRLKNSLQNCDVCHFKDGGHTLLLVRENMYIHHITSWLALIKVRVLSHIDQVFLGCAINKSWAILIS